jgi:hypothetical protein
MGVSCAAFITACNPFSNLLSNEENAKRQADLAAELKRRSRAENGSAKSELV